MPVGTQGSVKTLGTEDIEALGFELILSNTYHLELRPTSERIERLGGLHHFMDWKGGILTDSGGYQVMSLSKMRKITDEGVEFRSHLDGSKMFLSPERAIQIQGRLGVDISMALDVCAPYPCSREEAASAMAQTHRWAPRNLAAARDDQAVFGIVQGGVHEDLRRESADFLRELPFAGFAVGGVSVGEPTELQYPVVKYTAPLLPADKARYLMGVGHPGDILHAVICGIDLFDCVLPTRMARHHALYTMNGRVNILNQKWEEHDAPFDPDSVFPATERYSAAYIRHLFKAGEPLGARLASLHNLSFYGRLMQEIRSGIETNSLDSVQLRYANA
jgi:queuine tRNA-ribosyltransferase